MIWIGSPGDEMDAEEADQRYADEDGDHLNDATDDEAKHVPPRLYLVQ
jgi:hypothetical protein